MKLREYFLCAKKTKMTILFNNFFSSRSFTRISRRKCVHSYVRTPAPASDASIMYCHERMSKTDREENKLLNKVVIFVFNGHKKYSRSFIKLRLNH